MGYIAWKWEVVQPVAIGVVVRLVGVVEDGRPMAGGRPPKPPTRWVQMRRRGRGRPEEESAGSPLKMTYQIHNRPVWHQKNVKT